jgi:hypothetical protein
MERESWRAQVNENSARLAYAWGVTTTTGVGSLAHEDEIDFGLTFIEQPMVSYGTVVTNQIEWEPDDTDSLLQMPGATGFVFSWRQDPRGFYVGAHVGVTVTGGELDVELEHHFTFMGIAMKDVTSGAKLDL